MERPTIELSEVSVGRAVSPPAPPSGTNMRAWFAGLALGNPELMKNVSPEQRVQEALRLADELMVALSPKVPSESSLAAPSEADMQVWDKRVSDQSCQTVGPKRIATKPGIPAPARRPTPAPTSEPKKYSWAQAPNSVRPTLPAKPAPGAGSYSLIAE